VRTLKVVIAVSAEALVISRFRASLMADERIFISYSTKDGVKAAAALRKGLKAKKHSVWQDRREGRFRRHHSGPAWRGRVW